MSRVRFFVVLVVLALGGGVGRAEHRLEPAEVRPGEVARYRVTTGDFASARALAVTTVHPPGAPEVRVRRGDLVYTWSEDGGFLREDGFTVRGVSPGDVVLKGAVVERSESEVDPLGALDLAVTTPRTGNGRGPLLAGGLFLLVAGLLLFERARQAREVQDLAEAPSPTTPTSLAAVREARMRGDVRSFYVALYAALRAEVRRVTGRSPRDARGLSAAARGAGLDRARAETIYQIAQRSERVAFGGERPDAAGLATEFAAAEDLMAALARTAAPSPVPETEEGKTP